MTAVLVLLIVIGALTVIGFVVDALRWLLIVAAVIAVVALLFSVVRRSR